MQLILEAVLLLNVLVAVRVLVYVAHKVLKRKIVNRKIIIALYILIFYAYCDMNENIVRTGLDIYLPASEDRVHPSGELEQNRVVKEAEPPKEEKQPE